MKLLIFHIFFKFSRQKEFDFIQDFLGHLVQEFFVGKMLFWHHLVNIRSASLAL